MNFHNLMIITSIATIGFGTGFIIAPKALIALCGLSSTPIIEFSLRLYATAIFGVGALALLIRLIENYPEDIIMTDRSWKFSVLFLKVRK
jgi:hypothetical protein